MRGRTVALALAFLTLLTHPSISLAQGAPAPNEWSIVKIVPPGDELVVKLKNGQTIKGRLKVISDVHLTLARGQKSFDIDRQDVRQIHRIVPKSAAKPTLIGAGTGAAIGAGGIAIAVAADESGGDDGEAAAAILGVALIGAGIGALVGLAFGSRQKKVLIYEAR
ncbi:MAG TPA: hypothetical protein VEY09_16325 [Pyrinomonadaceae bacterium]|nr:hypothetical protein [Pyrinomonadaceae bacterium]